MAGDSSHSMYSLHNVVVTGGVFNATNISHASPDAGIILLSQSVSHGAMHDSSERDPPPKCHPETRIRVIDYLLEWIRSLQEPGRLWLYAPFGEGKSAVMQTTIEHLQALDRLLFAGAFFFGRGKPGCDQAKFLFPTIVYQIAINIPEMRMHINEAMLLDPTICTKSIDVQVQKLLIGPFTKCQPALTHPATVFIDGLDECEGTDAQCSILRAILTITSIQGIPLRFIVASRPEKHITNTINPNLFHPNFRLLSLHEFHEVDKDIERYLSDGFKNVLETHPAMEGISSSWPIEDDVWTIVRRASGQFLYAQTVLAFIRSEWEDPAEQLAIVLALQHPQHSDVFSTLDPLLHLMLQRCPKRDRLVRILGFIACFPGRSQNGLSTIATMAQVKVHEAKQILMSLGAIFQIWETRHKNYEEQVYPFLPDRTIVRVYHVSFTDFLKDAARSGAFHVAHQGEYYIPYVDSLLDEALNGRSSILHPRSVWVFFQNILSTAYSHMQFSTFKNGTALELWPKLKATLNSFVLETKATPPSSATSRAQTYCGLAAVWGAMENWLTSSNPSFQELAVRGRGKAYRDACMIRLHAILSQSVGPMDDRFIPIIEYIETCNLSPIVNYTADRFGSITKRLAQDLAKQANSDATSVASQILEGVHRRNDWRLDLHPITRSVLSDDSTRNLLFIPYRACKLRAFTAVLSLCADPGVLPGNSLLSGEQMPLSETSVRSFLAAEKFANIREEDGKNDLSEMRKLVERIMQLLQSESCCGPRFDWMLPALLDWLSVQQEKAPALRGQLDRNNAPTQDAVEDIIQMVASCRGLAARLLAERGLAQSITSSP